MTARRRRILTVVLFIAVAIGSFILGRYLASADLDASAKNIRELQAKNGQLMVEDKKKAEHIATMKAELDRLKEQWTTMFLPVRSIEIRSNESVPLATGHFNIGLIGIPRQESVEINVNGK